MSSQRIPSVGRAPRPALFSCLTIAAALALGAPSAAQAQYGYYDYGRYERPAVRYDRYGRAYSYDRYGRPVYANSGYYNRGYSNSGYYGRSRGYYGDRYYNDRRCSGTTGTIVGGAVGALLGREVGRSGSRYSYNRGSGTTGAIIGGAIGALAGNATDKADC